MQIQWDKQTNRRFFLITMLLCQDFFYMQITLYDTSKYTHHQCQLNARHLFCIYFTHTFFFFLLPATELPAANQFLK